jgi:nucleoside-diphosphate-sugar epimerase
VREDHPLVPLTHYNRFKGMCEPLLFKHQGPDFTCVTIRPSTVCGYSPRARLDLTVNILTNHAVNKGRITVFGGDQHRPNLHIKDMVRLYQTMLDLPPEKIAGETFNVGYRNLSVMEIAQQVKKVVEEEYPELGDIEIVRTPSDDNRSYRVTSDKIKNMLGFEPIFTVEDAIRDLCQAFREGKLPDSFDNPWYYNVKQLQERDAA